MCYLVLVVVNILCRFLCLVLWCIVLEFGIISMCMLLVMWWLCNILVVLCRLDRCELV